MTEFHVAREYARLYLRKKKLEDEIKQIRREMDPLVGPVQDAMLNEGMRNLPIDVDGEHLTLYVSQAVRVRPKKCERCNGNGCDRCAQTGSLARSELVDALERDGIEELIKVDVDLRTLSSFVKGELAAGRTVPPELHKVVDVETEPELRARRATVTKSESAAAAENYSKQKGGE